MISYLRLHKEKIRQVLLFLSIFVGLLVVHHQPDNDTYFILNHGRYVWNYGIPHIEPFTIHEGWNFIMQQWLTGVIFWKIYTWSGFTGLLGLVYVVGAVMLYLHYRLCLYVSNGNKDISAVITAVAGVIVARLFFVMRPQILSTLLLLMTVFLCEHYWRTNKFYFLLGLCPLSLLLINLHAAMWPMLLIVTLPYLLEAGKVHNFSRVKNICCVDIGAFLLAFINPYGINGITYVFRTNNKITSFISEMQPLSLINGYTTILFVYILAVLWFYTRHRLPLRYLLLSLGVAFMALKNVRSVFLFSILGTFPIAYCLSQYHFQSDLQLSKKRVYFRIAGIFCVLLIGAYDIYHSSWWNQERQTVVEDNQHLDYQGIDFLLTREKPENIILWTDYNTGNYPEFYGIKCYLDTRAEVFMKNYNGKEDVLEEYLKMESGQIYYKDVLNRYPFTHILTMKKDMLYTYLMHDSDYALIYDNENDEDGCRIFKKISKDELK